MTPIERYPRRLQRAARQLDHQADDGSRGLEASPLPSVQSRSRPGPAVGNSTGVTPRALLFASHGMCRPPAYTISWSVHCCVPPRCGRPDGYAAGVSETERTLFDGHTFSEEGQFYLASPSAVANIDIDRSFYSHRNGLCGGAAEGILFCMVSEDAFEGVTLKITLQTSTPVLDDTWEDVVETSFVAPGSDTTLLEWGQEGDLSWPCVRDVQSSILGAWLG